jgi:O-antigen ligase
MGVDIDKRALVFAGLVYFICLSVALIWLHLPSELVLALTIGGVALVVLMLNPLLGVHAFVMLVYFESILTSESGVTGMKIAGPIILLGWFLSLAIRREPPFRFDTFTVAMFVFLAWLGMSSFYALDSDEALSRFYTFVQLVVATLMFMSVVDTVPRIRGVFWSIVVWTSIATVAGLGRYYSGMSRTVSGFGGDRNEFAIYANIAIVCTYVLYQSSKGRGRLLLSVILPILFLGLALTFSRMGVLAMMLSLLVVGYRIAREKRIAAVLVALAILVLIVAVLPESFWARVGTIGPSMQGRRETVGIRVDLWSMALQMIRDRPITGVGLGNFATASMRYAHGEYLMSRLVAHNAYISIAAETGLVGLCLFLAVHGVALKSFYRAMSVGTLLNAPSLKMMSIATEGCLFAIMFSALSLNSEGLKYLWLFFGLAASLGRIAAHSRVTESPRQSVARVTPAADPGGGQIHAPV